MLPGVGRGHLKWTLKDRKEFHSKNRGDKLSMLSHTPVP